MKVEELQCWAPLHKIQEIEEIHKHEEETGETMTDNIDPQDGRKLTNATEP